MFGYREIAEMENVIRYLIRIVFALLVVLCCTGVLLSVYYTPTPQQAYSSIEKITIDVPFGSSVRSVHHYSTSLFIVALVVLLCCLGWMNTIPKQRWYAVLGMVGMGLLAAWTGRLLPQDVYAQTSQLVVGFGITEAPFGWVLSTLLGLSAQSTVFLTQILTVHTFVCGALLVAIGIWLKKFSNNTQQWWQLLVASSMAVLGTVFLNAPLSEQAGFAQHSAWAGGPWWMFRFIHNWNEWFGAELTSYILSVLLAVLVWLPFSNTSIELNTRRIGMAILLLLLVASSY